MATPTATPAQRQLADALHRMRSLQTQGHRVFQTRDFARVQREALEAAGFLRRVIRGWYIATAPGEKDGDTTAWHASSRDFIGAYCNERFGSEWCLSAESSLLVHAGVTVLPSQIIILATKAQRNVLKLLGDNSMLDLSPSQPDDLQQIEKVGPVQILSLPVALIRAQEVFFRTYATDAQIALRQVRDSSQLVRLLLHGEHSFIAGRLAAAFRAIGQPRVANDIAGAMTAAGYRVDELNPFVGELPKLGGHRAESPYVDRIRIMWRRMREDVLRTSAPEPGRPENIDAYLNAVTEAYKADAYHSLSIEGYAVSEALIARVSSGEWNPDTNTGDEDTRNAMAAHGYYLAHKAVRESLVPILAGENAGTVVDRDHSGWYRQLFTPSVTANVLSVEDLAGYRNDQVFIRNADHVPPHHTAVWDMMAIFFELLVEEPSAAVRAVLGHFIFVFIHPYMDGNGRMGRFLMNAMLASGGYPWTIIPVDRRNEYLQALNAASSQGDIVPFARFVDSCIGVPQTIR